ncbi:MAG: dipeptidase PepE [Chthoniobacterales bacterium]|nr:dipeptidase PepE [Chthoniobacterales bacterium]
MTRRILLLSSSTVNHGGYLDYAEEEIGDFLGQIRKILFVPFALYDRANYLERVKDRFNRMGYEVDLFAKGAAHKDAAVFIGGGNTFRLLKALYDLDLLATIRDLVAEGAPYMGSSAGSNVACPTIRTTNDMPIVQPPSFDALGLVPFQINPHYLDVGPGSTHMGETREERIEQFLEENEMPVVGLREGAWLRVEAEESRLGGIAGARLFRRGRSPAELERGATIKMS